MVPWAHLSQNHEWHHVTINSATFVGLTVMTDRSQYSICNRQHLARAAMQHNNTQL